MGIGANMRDAKNPFPKNELQKKYYILAALSAEEHGAFKKVIIFVTFFVTYAGSQLTFWMFM